ncbi:MAG: CAP domain-containing protein [Ramlibacter sp.]
MRLPRAPLTMGALCVAICMGAGAAHVEGDTTCLIRDFQHDALQHVNAARAQARDCGDTRMAAAPPLVWNDALFDAAAEHSRDMANHNYFDHTGHDGSRVTQRATARGYAWRAIGENIAGGDGSVDRVMDGWLRSAGHCRNIMNPEYADIAVACVERDGTRWGTYWTMVLGRRRK